MNSESLGSYRWSPWYHFDAEVVRTQGNLEALRLMKCENDRWELPKAYSRSSIMCITFTGFPCWTVLSIN